MPLKEAKHEVERQLVNKAISIHKTTYKAAEALKVNQSTIVKLLKRINNQK
jgi:DNA-binding NtrC family response regulator